MSLILRVGWVWTLEKYVTKFYVTNLEGRVGLNPNLYDVTLFSLFFLKASLIPLGGPQFPNFEDSLISSKIGYFKDLTLRISYLRVMPIVIPFRKALGSTV